MRITHKKTYSIYLSLHRRLISSTTKVIEKNDMIAQAYRPELAEHGKYEKWEKEQVFKGDVNPEKPPFSMILPPPNVTGKLHLGHALACTVQDVIVRRKRALGHNVVWIPGTDHAGIATQTVVEKYLKSTMNLDRQNMNRERFNTEVWRWVICHGDNICNQLRVLGCSLDWSKQTFTMDPRHNKAVNEAFINLFEKGLIYRKKALVNWCGALKSTVSDIEVEDKVIDGPTDIKIDGYKEPVKFGLFYTFAYQVFDSSEKVIVSTTMPETMMGDTAIAVHPSDERYKNLEGKRVYHPFRNVTIPIIFDEFVNKDFGTGAVKVTPAHSKVDYKVAKKHSLPLLQVIGEDGYMKNTGKFDNLKRYECREVILKKLNDLGLFVDIRPHNVVLPVCSRTGDVIDYLPKEQWFVSCSKMNEKAMEFVHSGELEIEPDKYVKNWYNWTKDDRDWCISRQLWWGHQVPAYKCKVDNHIAWIAAPDEKTARIKASKCLRTVADDITAERDTDVLDTWFSSAIYPFAALGWPDVKHNAEYKQFYPLSLMATGHDILGFWVHRMVILGHELTGKLPFKKILLHGIVCDNKGAKMSKSRGNIIDPIDVIEGISMLKLKEKTMEMHKSGVLNKEELDRALGYHKSNFSNTDGIPQCGVDALRFTLLSQDVKSHFVNFDVHICHSNKLFCNKIWQSIIYMQLSYAKLKPLSEQVTVKDLTYFDKWILSRLAGMVGKVNVAMDAHDFHLATKALRSLIYNEFCDVYLEATKPGFLSENPRVGYAHGHTLSAVLNTSLRCLNPFMVYVTEEVIPKIPGFQDNIIFNFKDLKNKYFDFPQYEHFKVWKNTQLEQQVEKVLDTMSMVRELKGLYCISNKLRPRIRVLTTDNTLAADLKTQENVVLHLTRCSGLDLNDDTKRNYVRGFLDKETEVSVEVVGDEFANTILAARNRIHKKIKKLEENLVRLEEKLTSQRYITTVPEWTQVLDRETLMTKKKELSQLQRMVK